MKLLFVTLSAAIAVAAVAQTGSGSALVLHPVMKDVVAPQAQILWDVGNNAMDDNGNPDGKRVKAADWVRLTSAAQAMKDAADSIVAAPRIMVVASGMKLQDEGGPGASTAAQIQGYVDKDAKLFATRAQDLAVVSDALLIAARTKDAAKLVAASGRLDEVCEACHVKFWYPEQPTAQ